ncbi:MAG TPA: patatin-like phospholipase family protein [Pyrinomonadaceae bacterium]|nr:patatin-like phospholipase family protein [Pyrinomonadaceae bacterium]
MPSRNQKVPRLALALSGGAARGIAHIGVLRALIENKIPIDCIAGTSAGSLVGGAIASGMPLEEIESIGRSLRWRDIGRMTMSRLGVQTNERLEQYLRQRFPIIRFEDLPIPLAVVATDLQSGKAVVMRDKGDVPFAIRASCAIPGWYVPVVDGDGRQLVDGGLVAMVPAQVARAFDVDIVVGVDVNAEGAKFLAATSVIGIMLQSMMMVQRTATLHQLQQADWVIKPRVGHIRWDEMTRAEELIAAGYEAGLENIEGIRNLIRETSESTPRWYQFRRRKSMQRQRS